ncbi:hypothetical protein J6590_050068, partial [Homalodisca vitripennis]
VGTELLNFFQNGMTEEGTVNRLCGILTDGDPYAKLTHPEYPVTRKPDPLRTDCNNGFPHLVLSKTTHTTEVSQVCSS